MKKMLIGLHDRINRVSLESLAKSFDYVVEAVAFPQQMIEKAKAQEYDVYIMDLNLGSPNSPDISSAIEIWNIVKYRVEKGFASFLGISEDYGAVEEAKRVGIPAETKPIIFVDWFNKLSQK